MELKVEKIKKSYRTFNRQQKKAILAEINEGKRDPKEILKEHGISTELSLVLKRWPEQIKRNENNLFVTPKRKYEEDLKHDIIRQIEFGQLTTKEAIQKYDIVGGKGVIEYWRKKYSSHITPLSQIKSMSESEKKDLTSTQKQKKEFEKALEQANLKILGLETMIDIAEKELNIEIRKKSGSKQ